MDQGSGGSQKERDKFGWRSRYMEMTDRGENSDWDLLGPKYLTFGFALRNRT